MRKSGTKAFAMRVSGFVLVCALAGGMTVSAQPAPGDGPGFGMHRPPLERLLGPGAGGRWWNNPKVIEQLKLTDDQRKDMDQILLQHRENLIDMRADVEKAELAMEPLVGADQPNEQAILAQIDRIAQARAELEKANARFLLALRAKLSPEQFKELKTLRDDRRERMRMWRNPKEGGPSAPDAQPGPQGAPGAAPPPPGPGGPQAQLQSPDNEPNPPAVPQVGTIE